MEYPDQIRKKIIDANMTLIQTLKLMDEGYTKSMLVFNDDKFIGIITNGDLQRAIIAKVSFDTPIEKIVNNQNKLYAHVGDSIENIKAWMIEMRAEFMPILDDKGELIDVFFWDEIFPEINIVHNREKIDLPVVIMAGGKGTRLKPLTNVVPKPLVPVGDKTILEIILDQFESIGCHKFYISVNYKADMMEYYLNQLEHHYDIEFFMEDKPLGTIGSVSLLRDKIHTPFFVSNCDSINEQDYRDVYDYHVRNRNDLTTVTTIKSFKIPYGVIETGEDGLMTSINEKPELTYQVNTGVYILNPSCIDEIPVGQFFHITHLMDVIKARGGRIGCFPVSERSWKDMGEWPEYLKMIHVL